MSISFGKATRLFFKHPRSGKSSGLKHINTSISSFDGDEKGTRRVDTLGGLQEVVVLTELGLNRLIGRSMKPIARPFQKWVATVIRDIQRNGRYETDNLREELVRQEKRMKESDHNALISAYHRKNVVYFGKIKQIENKTLIKLGSTYDIKRRAGELIEQFGSMTFFHVVECALFRNYEQFLRNHGMIAPFAFTGPINEDGEKSNEVYLMTDEEIERAKEVTKRNLSKYQTVFITAPDDDIRDIKDEIKETKEELRKLTEAILEKKVEEEKTEKLFEEKTDVRKHKQGKGDKIQRYSPDGQKLLETYENYIGAIRDAKLDNPSRSPLKMAAKGNFLYKGFRWARLDRKLPNDTVQELEETVAEAKSVRKGYVAMLDLNQTQIVKVFTNQKEAAADRQFKGCAAISNAIKRGSQSGGHYFKMWFDCSEELKEAFLEHNDLPDRKAFGNSTQVQQTDIEGNTKVFASVQEVQKVYGVGRKKLKEAIENDIVLRGFKWSWVE